MSTTTSTFFHSCLKVSLNPCNNFPAPNHNRPKTYSSCLTNHRTAGASKLTSQKTKETDATIICLSNGIRSLSKLYETVPDYCDINHLPEHEFYSTLDSLRSSCRKLQKSKLSTTASSFQTANRAKAIGGKFSKSSEAVNNTTTTTAASPSTQRESCKSKSGKGSKNRESHVVQNIPIKPNKNQLKATSVGVYDNVVGTIIKLQKSSVPVNQHQFNRHYEFEENCFTEDPTAYSINLHNYTQPESITENGLKAYKQKLDNEVNGFKKTSQELEEELTPQRVPSMPFSCHKATYDHSNKEESIKIDSELKIPPVGEHSVSLLRKSLRKAFSVNDINSLTDSPKTRVISKNENVTKKLAKPEALAFKDGNRLSNYFIQKVAEQNESSSSSDTLPRIVFSPSTEITTSTPSASRVISKREKKALKTEAGLNKAPFTVFKLTSISPKKDVDNELYVTPVHPVARQNLAATLRFEISKKKLRELKKSCTNTDIATPHFDWEVRKTPAWKSLSLNKSHKETLAFRLATRKAEQALQQQEYELNRELMTRRVKSTPLLLEGTTLCTPNMSKLTRCCQQDGGRHACHDVQYKISNAFNSDCAMSGSNLNSNRLNTLRKSCTSSAQTVTRHSRNSLVRSLPLYRRRKKTLQQEYDIVLQKPMLTPILNTLDQDEKRNYFETIQNKSRQYQHFESGDDLSSIDRAFL